MFSLKLGSELQNLVKKFQSSNYKYKQITGRISTKWKISTKWNAQGVKLTLPYPTPEKTTLKKSSLRVKTRIEDHIKKDNKSHIFKHLHSLSFKIIDKASSKLDLKIKEALRINWRKPNLNTQQNHLALTLLL